MPTNYKKLHEAIIAASEAKSWDIAKGEWDFVGAYHDSSDRHCLCGHHIVEVCQIANKKNQNVLEVGNECVKQFDANLDKLGHYIIELSRNPDKNTNKKVIDFAFSNNIINDWERKFCIDRIGSRKSTSAQETTRNKINKKIIDNLFGEPCPSCKIGKLITKHGKFGSFIGCNRFPNCKYIKS